MSVVLLTALAAAFGCGRARTIPEGKLAAIYADMFLADQWISAHHGQRFVADTSQVYEPILARYGYTAADYRKTVGKYMSDPEKFSKVMEAAESKLQKYSSLLERQEELTARLDSILQARNENTGLPDFRHAVPYRDILDGLYSTDSISIIADSTGLYELHPVIRDTMYRGPELIIR